MNSPALSNSWRRFRCAAWLALMILAASLALHAQTNADNAPPAPLPPLPPPTNAPASSASWTNSIPADVLKKLSPQTLKELSTPSKQGITITEDEDDDDDSGDGNHKKGSTTVIHMGDEKSGGYWEVFLIPLAGIIATFGTPILIVFVVFYFKYRQRQEQLATVREYLNKGLPVPPELLYDSRSAAAAAAVAGAGAARNVTQRDARCDLNRGFKWTFIGLAITVALFVTNPHSTSWGWGLIPTIIGIGYLLSGWVQMRDRPSNRDGSSNPPPGGTPPST